MKNIGPSFLKVERKEFEWCHLCGQRYTGNWAELWISKNAEHGHEATPSSQYVRFCGDCSRQIAESVKTGEIVQMTRHPNREKIYQPSEKDGLSGLPDAP